MLRNNQTPAEEELWRLLRKHKLGGRECRRQHSNGSCIVDFYCAAEKLVVEVDGSVQDTKTCDVELQHLGYKVIRIRNSEIFEQPQVVLQKITAAFENI
ncbi:endonuclease domain-containing protein [Pontibacter russatus]|uniref:endonuclease domain-containing protein n=1 Tax=Pontibacter russatus TaxID=2694929 RepID=UPI0013796144|nr:DUF559 domain-containing protein [Pontibacter russatus]